MGSLLKRKLLVAAVLVIMSIVSHSLLADTPPVNESGVHPDDPGHQAQFPAIQAGDTAIEGHILKI